MTLLQKVFTDFSPSKKPPTRRKGLIINPFHSFLSGLLESFYAMKYAMERDAEQEARE